MAEESAHWDTGPAIQTSKPEEYPEPKAGRVTRWVLTTPDKVPVGVLLHDGGGVHWTPASTEDKDAQEHAAEILDYLRGHKQEGIALRDTLDGIKEAYTGDLAEDQVRFVPSR